MSTFRAGKEAMFQLETFFEGDANAVTMTHAPRAPRKAKGEPY